MTVSLVQWRALIGIFNCRISGTSANNRCNLTRKFVSMLENLLLFSHYLKGVCITVITLLYIFVLLLCHGDIEPKPGPKKLKKIPFLSVTGILIVYLLIASQNLHRWKHIFQCINTISYTYQKHNWILQHLIVCSK